MKFNEVQKNYIKCAVIMLVLCIGFFAINQTYFGLGSIAMAVIFIIAAISSARKNKEENDKKESK